MLEVYQATGSIAQAAKAVNANHNSARGFLESGKTTALFRDAHREALAEATRRGRDIAATKLEDLGREMNGPHSPRDLAALAKAFEGLANLVLKMDERLDKHATLKLQRDLLRKQLAEGAPTGNDGTVTALLDYLTSGKVGPQGGTPPVDPDPKG